MADDFWHSAIETLDAEELERRDDALLTQQFAYVKARSAFYQTKFASVETISNRRELANLPFTEKEELRASQELYPPFGDYLAVHAGEVTRVHKTSGTTGRPLYVALTPRDIEYTHECGARAYVSAGLSRTDRVVHCLN